LSPRWQGAHLHASNYHGTARHVRTGPEDHNLTVARTPYHHHRANARDTVEDTQAEGSQAVGRTLAAGRMRAVGRTQAADKQGIHVPQVGTQEHGELDSRARGDMQAVAAGHSDAGSQPAGKQTGQGASSAAARVPSHAMSLRARP
jgi:hypothetical protein